MDVAEQRVEIRLRRIVKPTAGAYCLLLHRAVLAVKDLDVVVAGYIEDSSAGGEESPSELRYGASLVFLGNSWVGGKQIVLLVEGEDAEQAAEKMKARLDHEPPPLTALFPDQSRNPHQHPVHPVHDWLRKQDELSRRMQW